MVKDYSNHLRHINTGMTNVLDTMYPDRWEFLRDENNLHGILTIYFEKVVIKNKNGLSTTIGDVFINFGFDYKKEVNTYVIYQNLALTSMSHSKTQYCNDYSHSHIFGFHPSSYVEGYLLNKRMITTSLGEYLNDTTHPKFCLGDNTPLVNYLHLIHNEGNNGIVDSDNYRMLFLALNEAIHWESLSGVPYRYIRDLSDSDNNNIILDQDRLLKIYAAFNHILNSKDIFISKPIENPILNFPNNVSEITISEEKLKNELFNHNLLIQDYNDLIDYESNNRENNNILRNYRAKYQFKNKLFSYTLLDEVNYSEYINIALNKIRTVLQTYSNITIY